MEILKACKLSCLCTNASSKEMNKEPIIVDSELNFSEL